MDKNTRSDIGNQVIAAYIDGLYTNEIAKKLDISESDVVRILELNGYIR